MYTLLECFNVCLHTQGPTVSLRKTASQLISRVITNQLLLSVNILKSLKAYTLLCTGNEGICLVQ